MSSSLRAWPLVSGSLALVRAHPVVSLSIGTAVVLSLIAVPTGLGALFAPWFVCELFSVQLAMKGETPAARGQPWAGAALVVLCTVVVIAIAGWIAALGFGPDFQTADRALAPLPWPEALRRGSLVAGTLALAVAAGTPFIYAPLILLDRGGRLGGACLESAALVRRGGAIPHYALAFFAYLLSLSPALVSMIIVGRTVERAATPLGALVAFPFLPASIPLGLGLVTHAYLAQRDGLPDAHLVRAGSLPRGLVAFLSTVSLAPLVGLLLMAIAGLVPSRPPIGTLPPGAVVVVDAPAREHIDVPLTTIEIELEGSNVAIYAGDHDGVGVLPNAFVGAIGHVRVGRIQDDFAIELASEDDEPTRVVRVDRAGLRVDDSVEARLRSRSPDAVLIAFIVCFAICALGSLAYLGPLGEARAKRRQRVVANRRAFFAALAVMPFSLMAFVAGAIALFGLPG